MVMGRMVYNFTSKASVFRIHAWRFGLVFVLLDVAAFFVQLVGLVFAGGDDPQDQVKGIRICKQNEVRKTLGVSQSLCISHHEPMLTFRLHFQTWPVFSELFRCSRPMLTFHPPLGIGFQQVCIILFLVLAIRFHMTLLKQTMSTWRLKDAMFLLYVLYVVLILITTRIIFRLVEYSGGMDSKLAKQEAYQYALDSTLMFIASVLLNIWHPVSY